MSTDAPSPTLTPPLAWSAALVLEVPIMDRTHQEFVELLAEARAAADGELCAAWQRLIEHTVEHFGREDAWMRATHFAAGNCHATNHRVVLSALHEGLRMGQAGDLASVRAMAGELAAWFPWHAQSMDAALALHMRRSGLDPETGALLHPEALPAEAITGCGSGHCGDARAVAKAAAVA